LSIDSLVTIEIKLPGYVYAQEICLPAVQNCGSMAAISGGFDQAAAEGEMDGGNIKMETETDEKSADGTAAVNAKK
jgi:hypothetical protein